MKCKAYAKVNLILKVVDKLDNGYHELQMLNAKIDLWDEIEVIKNSKGFDNLYFLDSSLDPVKDNLVLRVLDKVKSLYNITDTFDIYIKKNIPVGAGLGGGSTDAGRVVKAILDIYNIEMDLKKLSPILATLGADIPYSLIDNMAVVEGIGDRVSVIENIYDSEFVLVNPNIFISTKDIFQNNQTFSCKSKVDDLINIVKEEGYKVFSNDLETSACMCCKELENLKCNLSKYGHVVMSGSGSTFMVFGDSSSVYEKCKNKYPEYFVKKVKIIKE